MNHRILFLYSEMMPYMESVIASLVNDFHCQIKVISWVRKKITPHFSMYPDSVEWFNRDMLSKEDITNLIQSFDPELIYVSGRMDKKYLNCVKKFRNKKIIVMGCDTQLHYTIKQRIQRSLSKILYHNYFSHIWVPGSRQYAFARYLKFKDDQVIQNLLSGNTPLFSNIVTEQTPKKRILFVGRLEKVKNIDILIKVWLGLPKEKKSGWTLTLIGDGSLRNMTLGIEDIESPGFLEADEISKFINEYTFFCLPSKNEPWGVVVHEFASAGLPLLLSKRVGASDTFLINGYNGYFLDGLDIDSIENGLLKMMQLDPIIFREMGNRSKKLGQKITPQISAASLISVI